MRLFVFAGLAVLGGGCAGRLNHAEELARPAGLVRQTVETQNYSLAAWVRLSDPARPVTIYIEGDGAAYDGDGNPSLDPTPRKALALSLATYDPAVNVMYLARPCQYVKDSRCRFADWTTRRFDEPAVSAMNEAIDRLIPQDGKINLVGYSGGGAIAALLAERRADVLSLRTITGNLDPAGVNHLHHATENLSALNPMTDASKLSHLPQLHFVGDHDDAVPVSFADRFVQAEGEKSCASVVHVNAAHEEGWEDAWANLLLYPLPCSRAR